MLQINQNQQHAKNSLWLRNHSKKHPEPLMITLMGSAQLPTETIKAVTYHKVRIETPISQPEWCKILTCTIQYNILTASLDFRQCTTVHIITLQECLTRLRAWTKVWVALCFLVEQLDNKVLWWEEEITPTTWVHLKCRTELLAGIIINLKKIHLMHLHKVALPRWSPRSWNTLHTLPLVMAVTLITLEFPLMPHPFLSSSTIILIWTVSTNQNSVLILITVDQTSKATRTLVTSPKCLNNQLVTKICPEKVYGEIES